MGRLGRVHQLLSDLELTERIGEIEFGFKLRSRVDQWWAVTTKSVRNESVVAVREAFERLVERRAVLGGGERGVVDEIGEVLEGGVA